MLEYCLLPKISPFVNLNDRQHGFRGNYSTNTVCFVLKETVLNYFGSNSDVHACFVDISKAFDSVNHNTLMEKLLSCGIPYKYVNLLRYIYNNQFVKVRYKSSLSKEWKVNNGVRQGGVLSGLFFSIYIDSMIHNISQMKQGCRMGVHSSNVIAYADDIVLLAPSFIGLQMLLDKAVHDAKEMDLDFNSKKSKYMVFRSKMTKLNNACSLKLQNNKLEKVDMIRYLGFMISNNLSNKDDISRARNKFYGDFNNLLRKFYFASTNVKLFLFKHFCTQFYGGDLWFYSRGSSTALQQFSVGYHKAIKKLLGLSTHESNHFACQEASLFTFEHLLNKIKIFTALRLVNVPCKYVSKILFYLSINSVLFNETRDICIDKYDTELIFEQDKDAIVSRILFVQNHEGRMREGW